jgi:hypothetical protein
MSSRLRPSQWILCDACSKWWCQRCVKVDITSFRAKQQFTCDSYSTPSQEPRTPSVVVPLALLASHTSTEVLDVPQAMDAGDIAVSEVEVSMEELAEELIVHTAESAPRPAQLHPQASPTQSQRSPVAGDWFQGVQRYIAQDAEDDRTEKPPRTDNAAPRS